MQRYAEKALHEWWQDSQKKPLVIRGARQVGKTELVRKFARAQALDLVELNLETTRISEFEKETFAIDRCLSEIFTLQNKQPQKNTLLFIDEIQESEKAYSRLRYFKEQRPDIAVVAAGSLLEAKLRETKQKTSVGRISYLFLGPMTFQEFLLALGEELLVKKLQSLQAPFALNTPNPISESVHDKLAEYYRDYVFVGGMPEAVLSFTQHRGNYQRVRKIQNEILQSYREDITRYASGKTAVVLQEILHKIPHEIGQKVIYSRFSTANSTYTKEAIDLLSSIYLLHQVTHTNASGIPLRTSEDTGVFKLYFLDLGLLNAISNTPWSDINGLDYDQLVNKGNLAEQFAAQHMTLGSYCTSRPPLHYWLRDKKAHNAEVDFIKESSKAILPLEIKAGKAGSIKSLLQFMFEKKKLPCQAYRFDLKYREQFTETITSKVGSAKSKVTFPLINLPLYAIDRFFA